MLRDQSLVGGAYGKRHIKSQNIAREFDFSLAGQRLGGGAEVAEIPAA